MKKFKRIFKRVLFITTSLSVVAILTLFFYISNQIPPEISQVKNIELFDNSGNKYLSVSNDQKKTWIPLSLISENMTDAIISIEDKKFDEHSGFDIKRILQASFNNLKSGSNLEGASTITQQYVKNLFLSSEKTYERKLKEIMYAIQIENNYSKDDILEGYLNSIYFGHGIYGIEDASLFYFNKNAIDLNISESAVLASIPKGPTIYSPINNFDKNQERKVIVINELFRDEKITYTEKEEALEQVIEIYGVNDFNNFENAPYFQDKVLEELDNLNIDKIDTYLGLKVYTTLDSDLNEAVQKSVDERTPDNDLQVGVVAMDPYTGYVKTLIGGTDYNDSTYNRATSAERHPASTIKPFLYHTALDYGLTGTTTFMSAPTTFYVNNGNTAYSPTNFGSIYPYQDVSMAYAIATSDNIYAVKTHLFLGEDKLTNTLSKVNIHADALPSLALGATDVTVETMTNAYSHFANGGLEVTPRYITKVEDSEGNILYQDFYTENRIFEYDTTYLLNELMTGVFDRRLAININVTGSSIADDISYTYAAKSGSTDYDNWMIGFNPLINIGVWSGFDDNSEVTETEDRVVSKYIWFDAIEHYMKDKKEVWYERPDNVYGYSINPINGEVPSGIDYYKTMYYKKGTEPSYLFN